MNAGGGVGNPVGQQYQLILAGELMPGYDQGQAMAVLQTVFASGEERLQALFDGADHRVEARLDAEQALDLQMRLQAVGVRCRIERLSTDGLPLMLREAQAASEPAAPPRPAKARPTAPPRPATRPRQGSEHAQKRWKDAWANSHVVEDADNDDEYLALFAGPGGLNYLKRFQALRDDDGDPQLRPSWNWGAFLSPMLWGLYRKMWGWALVMGLAEVVLPLLLFILAHYADLGNGFISLIGFLAVANRVGWALVADALYFRHVHGTLMRIFGMGQGYASDLDVASAGGVSRSAVLVGFALSSVLALFMWSLVASIQPPVDLVGDTPRVNTGTDTTTQAASETQARQAENRWSETRRRLRELGQVINEWMATLPKEISSTQVSMFRLREDRHIERDMLVDAWGLEVQFLPDNEGYRLISAGPDKLFGTADDIMYRRVLAE